MAPRTTRRNRSKGKVLDVRSSRHGKLLDNLMVKGPLTLVFARLEGCGPCERFKKEVWTPLTKLKNRSMNLASIESSAMANTSLAPYTPQQYPTIMLVGPDKKPATFVDESGQKTNSMPRKNTLSEDKATLSSLVQSMPSKKNMNNTRNFRKANVTMAKNAAAAAAAAAAVAAAPVSMEATRSTTNLPIGRNSVARQPMSQERPASPYTNEDNEIPSMVNAVKADSVEKMNTPEAINAEPTTTETVTNMPTLVANTVAKVSKTLPAVGLMLTPSPIETMATATKLKTAVPNVASDILASQSAAPTGTASVVSSEYKVANPKGGRLLNAIRRHTASLKAVLGTRKSSSKAKTRRPRSKIGPGAN
jgi:hypothetical protein